MFFWVYTLIIYANLQHLIHLLFLNCRCDMLNKMLNKILFYAGLLQFKFLSYLKGSIHKNK